jgi:phosphoglycerate dehydrogenase-like enzyme
VKWANADVVAKAAPVKLVIFPAVEASRLGRILCAAGAMKVVNAADDDQARTEIADADAFFGKLTLPLLAVAKKLRWVQTPTASLEQYLFPELVEHPCVLTNMRGLFSDVIADHVFGYIICFARNFPLYLRNQTQRRWEPVGGESERSNFVAGPGTVSGIDQAHMHLADCTLGIVGMGSIGGEVARRGLAFGMRVIGVDPMQTAAPEGVMLWTLDRLGDLLAESDFVVIAAPHTPETAGLFGRRQFEQMKRTAYLINVGRGVIVRLDDLCEALRSGQIAGAGLDVFEIEPLPADHPLWQFDNVIITPHIAGTSPRIAERHLEVLLDNIHRFTHGQPLRNVADKQRWF